MNKNKANNHMKAKRKSKEPKNKELIEFLKLFKTSIILEALGWENNNSNGQKLRVQRLIWGNFKLEELEKIKTFVMSIAEKMSVVYYLDKEMDIMKRKKALKEELENF